MTGAGVLCSLLAWSRCQFVYFTVGRENREVPFGLFRYKSSVIIEDNNGERYKIDTCEWYDGDVDFDGYWKTARAFSMLSTILGVIAGATAVMKPPIGGLLFLFAALCQGLCLLFLKSDVCRKETNSFFENFANEQECQLGSSGIIACVALSCYFVAGVLCFVPNDTIGNEERVQQELDDIENENQKDEQSQED